MTEDPDDTPFYTFPGDGTQETHISPNRVIVRQPKPSIDFFAAIDNVDDNQMNVLIEIQLDAALIDHPAWLLNMARADGRFAVIFTPAEAEELVDRLRRQIDAARLGSTDPNR